MKKLLLEIRNQLGVSQEELANMIGVSFATVNRWENGHSIPSKAMQLRLYDICQKKEISLETIIQKKIESATDTHKEDGNLLLYHGSKSGIKGAITPSSRACCDFGKGFYMGTDPYQPLTLISDFENSRFYAVSMNLSNLHVLNVKPDMDWAMLVAYNRGKMDEAKGSALYDRYAKLAEGYDVIIGNIADDRMFFVLDNFFLGNITDKALIMSLSALQLGKQYVAITKKACANIKVETEIEFSYLEKMFLRDLSESNRAKGIRLATDICRNYRREGKFFDEIIDEGRKNHESN